MRQLFNNNKEDVIKDLQKLKDEKPTLYNDMKYQNRRGCMHQIMHNCILGDCKKHDYIDFDNISWHICFDDWSGNHPVGWHNIYSETLDICSELGVNV